MQRLSKVNRWMCPICKKVSVSLCIDDFFSEIIQQAAGHQEPEYVEIARDGHYRLLNFQGITVQTAKRSMGVEGIVLPTKRPKTESQLTKSEEGSIHFPIDLD
jgi:hypothetical protein